MKTDKEKFDELNELNGLIANWMYDSNTPYEAQHYRRIQQQCKKIINESKNKETCGCRNNSRVSE